MLKKNLFLITICVGIIFPSISQSIPNSINTNETWKYESNQHFQISNSGSLIATKSPESIWVNLWDVKSGKKLTH